LFTGEIFWWKVRGIVWGECPYPPCRITTLYVSQLRFGPWLTHTHTDTQRERERERERETDRHTNSF